MQVSLGSLLFFAVSLAFDPKYLILYLLEQAASPRDRLSMIAHRGLLPALTLLAEDENDTVRDYALFVLNALAGKNSSPCLDKATLLIET